MCPRFLPAALLACLVPAISTAQDGPFKVEPLAEPAPEGLSAAIREALQPEGVRILDGQGKPFAEVWLRKSVPATGKPAGAKGAILFPVLGEGELIGAIRYLVEGHDYRDQAIPPGVYTLRYGLQPVNGDHLGVSPYRDYALLVTAAKDQTLEPLSRKALETRSADAAGSNHPAVLMLIAPPPGAAKLPAMAEDQEKNLWGLVVPLPLAVPGESASTPLPVQMIVVGAAPV
jgi:hypothetical protein